MQCVDAGLRRAHGPSVPVWPRSLAPIKGVGDAADDARADRLLRAPRPPDSRRLRAGSHGAGIGSPTRPIYHLEQKCCGDLAADDPTVDEECIAVSYARISA